MKADKSDKAVVPDVFLKSVQVVSPRNVVTRIVAVDVLKAVGCYSGDGGYSWGGAWTVVPAHHLSAKIKAAVEAYRALNPGPGGGSYEVPLLECAVLYVPEATPVLHRQEMGLAASLSAEAGVSPAGGPEAPSPSCCFYDDPCCWYGEKEAGV